MECDFLKTNRRVKKKVRESQMKSKNIWPQTKYKKPTQVPDHNPNHSLNINLLCLYEKNILNICSRFTQILCEARGKCISLSVTPQQFFHVFTHTQKPTHRKKKYIFLLEPIAQCIPLPALTEDKHQLDPRFRFPHRREQGRETIRSNLLVRLRGMV